MRKKAFRASVVLLLVLSFVSALLPAAISASAANANAIYTHMLNRANGEKTLLTKGDSYKLDLNGATAVAGLADDGKKLTDGVETSYVGLSASATGKVTVTVDLKSATKPIADFEFVVLNDASVGAKLPASVKLYVSSDNSTFIEIPYGGEIEKSPEDKTSYKISFMPADGVTARYVRFTAEFSGNLYIAETAAYTYTSVEDVTFDGAQYVDKQGIIYLIPENSGTAQLSGYFPQFSSKVSGKATTNAYSMNSTTNGSDAKSSPDGTVNPDDITVYYIGVGAEDYPEGLKISALYIPESAANRPGYVVAKKYVVMHNTGNYSSAANAYTHFNYSFSAEAVSRSVSWHYTVDAKNVYQHLPDNESGWHDSSGTFGTGNYYGIGIENCVDGFPGYKDLDKYWNWVENNFRAVCKNVALLTAELCKRHGMDPGDCTLGTAIRQHWDSNRKNCPMEMRYNTATGAYSRDEGEMWVYYVSMVQRYWKGINGGGEYTTYEMKNTDNEHTDIIVPQYIRYNGTLYTVSYMFSNAFLNKAPLTSVSLPNTINSSGSLTKAFYLSSNIKAINVQEDSTYLSSDKGVLIYAKKTRITPEAYDENYAQSYVYPVTKKAEATAKPSDEEPDPIKYGDVDGNDKIDSTDYILVKRHILKVNELSGDAFKAADMDGNGKLDST
ncbi:MAG: N-acetylmuramoyl-L-alanine amidase, partial [Clostridia bacterium]|nr:N-acetylmuramoyl-L-alanine amidase [Clostridia bacterium]